MFELSIVGVSGRETQCRGVVGAQAEAPSEVLALLCFRQEKGMKARTRVRATKDGRITGKVCNRGYEDNIKQ